MNAPAAAPPPAAPQPPGLARALTRLLRPLVRLLLRAGMGFPQCADLLRALYVDVATNDILINPADRTDSRVSLLTGVHRKEIRRLREQGIGMELVPAGITLNSQIINRWLTTPRYADAEGRPVALPRTPQPADAPSFDALIRAVTTDLRPRAVLDEWLRQDIVQLDPEDRVVLRDAAFIPPAGPDQANRDALLYYFARNLHDHLAAASANIGAGAGEARFLDLSVHYDRLSPASVDLLRAEGQQAAQRLLLEINRRAHALAQAESGAPLDPAAPTQRINLGVYLYAENEPAPDRAPGRDTAPFPDKAP